MTIPLPILFAAAALAVLAWRGRAAAPAGLPPLVATPPAGLPALAPAAPAPSVSPLLLGAILLPWGLLAFSQFANRERPDAPPEPAPASGLDLRGRFTGPDAAADAAVTAALLGELADVVEFDGKQPTPRISTGAAVHDLRTAARELRCRGVKLGDRQPAVRDAIKAFLDERAGTDGGPLDADERAKWVAAYREVSRAAEAAAR